jgi:hypothetical protein
MVLVLEGHLTDEVLENALAQATERLATGPRPLVVDCQTMSTYTREARNLFVKWNQDHKANITRVAIITRKPMWKIVISAMALASTQEMRAFPDLRSAQRWALSGDEVEETDPDLFIDG